MLEPLPQETRASCSPGHASLALALVSGAERTGPGGWRGGEHAGGTDSSSQQPLEAETGRGALAKHRILCSAFSLSTLRPGVPTVSDGREGGATDGACFQDHGQHTGHRSGKHKPLADHAATPATAYSRVVTTFVSPGYCPRSTLTSKGRRTGSWTEPENASVPCSGLPSASK